jgi:hypothetical protein
MCAFCKQGVLKTDMNYQKGKVFHIQCFSEHGSAFATPDPEIGQLSARTRIELVQLKNMKVRSELEEPIVKSKPTRKKISKKSKNRTKKKSKPKRVKRKTKAKKSKKKSKRRR